MANRQIREVALSGPHGIVELANSIEKLSNEIDTESKSFQSDQEKIRKLSDELEDLERILLSTPAVNFRELVIKARLAEIINCDGRLGWENSLFKEEIAITSLVRDIEKILGVVPSQPILCGWQGLLSNLMPCN